MRRKGYALNDAETNLGAMLLAAPVFDSRERVCGSVSVGMLKVRYSLRLARRLANHLKAACRDFSVKPEAAG